MTESTSAQSNRFARAAPKPASAGLYQRLVLDSLRGMTAGCLRLDLPEDVVAESDPRKLAIVFGNLVGNAKWTGVRLSDVLDMAGVQASATQLVGRRSRHDRHANGLGQH